MAFPLRFRSLDKAANYSKRYSYPLTSKELWYWQVGTSIPLPQVRSYASQISFDPFLLRLRRQRTYFSRTKWSIARHVAGKLARIPTIAAIYVTGALAMNNCPSDDDIDLMIITYPHCLWLTRLLVVTYLHLYSLRRSPSLPEHSSPRVADKICDNLYLDMDNLFIHPDQNPHRNLYLAHEILQAKCLFDRFNVQKNFLSTNSWVKDYLPVAYASHNSYLINHKSSSSLWPLRLIVWLLRPINFICFLSQYIFMRSKITSEQIALGYAFFHPQKHSAS